MAFENYYKASTEVTGGAKVEIRAVKTLQGRSLKANEFAFDLKTRPIDGSAGGTLQTKKNTKRSVHAMTEIKYAERTSVQPAVRYSWESTQVLRPQRRR